MQSEIQVEEQPQLSPEERVWTATQVFLSPEVWLQVKCAQQFETPLKLELLQAERVMMLAF